MLADEKMDDTTMDTARSMKNCMKIRFKFFSNSSSTKIFKVEPETRQGPTYVRKNNYFFNVSEFVRIDYCLERERLVDDTMKLIVILFRS